MLQAIVRAAQAAGIQEGREFFVVSRVELGRFSVEMVVISDNSPEITPIERNVLGHSLQNVLRKATTPSRFLLWAPKPPIFLAEKLRRNPKDQRHRLVFVRSNLQPILRKGEKIAIEFIQHYSIGTT